MVYSKKRLSLLLYLVPVLLVSSCASMQQTQDSEAQQQGVCLDKDDRVVAKDCNLYLNDLYAQDPDPDKIVDPVTQTSVLTTAFKRPFLRTSGHTYPDAHAYDGYSPFQYDTATDLYKIEGNIGADTVIIFLQGGPMPVLYDGYMDPFEKDFLVAYVQQTHIVKKDILTSYDLTTQEAAQEQAENIAFIHAVYQDVHKRFPDKRIALAGHSMGCFLVLKYLADHANTFDKVLAMSCRVDMPLDFVRHFDLGQDIVYDSIGSKEAFMKSTDAYSLKPMAGTPYLVKGYKPIGDNPILASLGELRFSKRLQDIDLSNMLFFYSDRDEQVGGLSPDEIAFLQSRGAKLVNVGWDTKTLGHSRMLTTQSYLKDMAAFLQSK